MHTYKAGTYGNTFEVIQAEYFEMHVNEDATRDAYFYVTKRHAPEHYGDPSTTETVLVGFVDNPRFVIFDDAWVLAGINALDKYCEDH